MKLDVNRTSAADFFRLAGDYENHLSYSQFGEDRLLEVLLLKVKQGFYVDVGAHHPRRFSNTFLLNRRGWRGINIDLNKDLIKEFEVERPDDINLCMALSDVRESKVAKIFDASAVSTLDPSMARRFEQRWKVIDEREFETEVLGEVLDQNIPAGVIPNLLNVDVEGFDLRVLRGNNWTKYRPELVVVEIAGLKITSAAKNPVVSYMDEQGYELTNFMHVSAFFERRA